MSLTARDTLSATDQLRLLGLSTDALELEVKKRGAANHGAPAKTGVEDDFGLRAGLDATFDKQVIPGPGLVSAPDVAACICPDRYAQSADPAAQERVASLLGVDTPGTPSSATGAPATTEPSTSFAEANVIDLRDTFIGVTRRGAQAAQRETGVGSGAAPGEEAGLRGMPSSLSQPVHVRELRPGFAASSARLQSERTSLDGSASAANRPAALGALLAERTSSRPDALTWPDLEAALGGRILPERGANGELLVQRFIPGFASAPSLSMVSAMSESVVRNMMGSMSQAALGGRGGALASPSPFRGVVASGLARVARGGKRKTEGAQEEEQQPALANPAVERVAALTQDTAQGQLTGLAADGLGAASGHGAFGGAAADNGILAAVGTTAAGDPQAVAGVPTNAGDAPVNDGTDVSHVLTDPHLTVEDKITLMLMLIMNKMDKQIEAEGQYVNQLQQQQQNSKGGSKGPSIDVETMKLKRMIDKRSQMFDLLRQIIDRYNETAKGIIDKMSTT